MVFHPLQCGISPVSTNCLVSSAWRRQESLGIPQIPQGEQEKESEDSKQEESWCLSLHGARSSTVRRIRRRLGHGGDCTHSCPALSIPSRSFSYLPSYSFCIQNLASKLRLVQPLDMGYNGCGWTAFPWQICSEKLQGTVMPVRVPPLQRPSVLPAIFSAYVQRPRGFINGIS